MRVYATLEQLATSAYAAEVDHDDPAGVATLLRTASRMADEALRGRVYPTDPDGYPTDPDHTEALTDAVCAIAGELAAIGYSTAGGTQTWQSVGIGSVSLSNPATATGTITVMGLPVPPAAVVALRTVGRFQVSTPPGSRW